MEELFATVDTETTVEDGVKVHRVEYEVVRLRTEVGSMHYEFSLDGAMSSRPRLILVYVEEASQVLYLMLQCGVKFLKE